MRAAIERGRRRITNRRRVMVDARKSGLAKLARHDMCIRNDSLARRLRKFCGTRATLDALDNKPRKNLGSLTIRRTLGLQLRAIKPITNTRRLHGAPR